MNTKSPKDIKMADNLDPKQMTRKGRLKVAKKWAASITTSKKIKAYSKYFGVDKYCAAKELIMAKVELNEKFALRWASRNERKALAKKNKSIKKNDSIESSLSFSDECFYFIAGYTSGGCPFGITWEDAEKDSLIDSSRHEIHHLIPW